MSSNIIDYNSNKNRLIVGAYFVAANQILKKRCDYKNGIVFACMFY